MIIKKEDLERIKEWCRKIKEKEKRTYIIRRNPFQNEIPWTRTILFIDIDKPKEYCSRLNLVYDSSTDTLWRFVDNKWISLKPPSQ
ncbi:MAG: hypothetical protein QXW70_02515 [Candidatus Anstonellales archaeon]